MSQAAPIARMSYADYLLKVVKAHPDVIPFYLHETDAYWGCGIDAISALDCWGIGLPGFGGLKLPPTAAPVTTFFMATFSMRNNTIS